MNTTAFTLALTAGFAMAGLPMVGAAQQSDNEYLGTWQGSLDTGHGTLRLVLHVERSPAGALEGTMDSPDQGARGIPATSVSIADGALTFSIERIAMTYVAKLSTDGRTLSGTFRQGQAELPLELAQVTAEESAAATPDRPQNPKPPFPYRSEEVEIHSAPDVTLAGTLTLPPGEGPFPAAVLVTGSGPQDRDESLMGHKPFLVLADHLTRHGIAVLRYDDRGVAKSTGTFAAATSEDFVTDALAAVTFLHARSDIDAVGIVGHSEGGLVGPMAAVRSDQVDYVVMLAGSGLPGAEIIQMQGALIARAAGAPEEEIAFNQKVQQRIFSIVESTQDSATITRRVQEELERTMASLTPEQRSRLGPVATSAGMEAQVKQATSPWFRFFLTYDPRPTLEKVKVPVLALNGGHDLQVPPEADLREVAAALKRGGNPDVTTRLLPGLNHLFQKAPTGSPAEYAQISETMNPVALEAVSSWILQRFGAKH